ncbi:MAG: hypothetical protein F4Y03_10285 [Alphaproteobacteria bacterium]|nr:hypothetical protein [Alphaproteobacteria bacterium]
MNLFEWADSKVMHYTLCWWPWITEPQWTEINGRTPPIPVLAPGEFVHHRRCCYDLRRYFPGCDKRNNPRLQDPKWRRQKDDFDAEALA